VTRGYNAMSSGLSFASTYYDYKAKRNRYGIEEELYGYEGLTSDSSDDYGRMTEE